MPKFATTSLVVLGLLAATSALALDLPRKNQPIPGQTRLLRPESATRSLGATTAPPHAAIATKLLATPGAFEVVPAAAVPASEPVPLAAQTLRPAGA